MWFRTICAGFLVILVVAYLGIGVFHYSNGLDVGGSLVGGVRDVRVLISCRDDVELVKAFVNRTGAQDRAISELAVSLDQCH